MEEAEARERTWEKKERKRQEETAAMREHHQQQLNLVRMRVKLSKATQLCMQPQTLHRKS